ncbi:MAG: type IV secretory system conjugative DNA transfer family protein [Maledivibacter sp.]|jgi:hypothetical protein|nr:type IV secretory system conjugative DNA transfer family protein [Maledivibacter sp.]
MVKPIGEKEVFKGHHTFVCGMTQNGKTAFTVEKLKQTRQPVLFFNPQHEKVEGFVLANIDHKPSQIIRALKMGLRVDYRASLDDEEASWELYYLVDNLFRAGFTKQDPIIFAIDEVHIQNDYKQGKKALKKVANRGLTFGIHAVFISQRPANVPLTIVTQADKHYIFKTGLEKEYFTRKGIKYDRVKDLIEQGGEYSYVEFDGASINGPYKEAL